MAKQSDLLYLGHMLDYSRKAFSRAAAVSRADFDANEDVQIVLTHLIQIVGEAANNVSPATRVKYPEIPWERITGMRHRIVHDYVNIDVDIVWEIATKGLPDLIAALEKFTPPEPPSA